MDNIYVIMFLLTLSPFMCMFGIYFLVNLLSGTIDKFYISKNIFNKLILVLYRYKFLVSIFLFLTSFIGMYEMGIFYLSNGGYFWFVILTMGLYLLFFIVPFGSVFLPIQKNKLSTLAKIFFYFVASITLIWIVLLALKTHGFVYTDESETTKRTVSLFWKNIGLFGVGLNLIIQIVYLINVSISGHYYKKYWLFAEKIAGQINKGFSIRKYKEKLNSRHSIANPQQIIKKSMLNSLLSMAILSIIIISINCFLNRLYDTIFAFLASAWLCSSGLIVYGIFIGIIYLGIHLLKTSTHRSLMVIAHILFGMLLIIYSLIFLTLIIALTIYLVMGKSRGYVTFQFLSYVLLMWFITISQLRVYYLILKYRKQLFDKRN